jgi:hypothetical protein
MSINVACMEIEECVDFGGKFLFEATKYISDYLANTIKRLLGLKFSKSRNVV